MAGIENTESEKGIVIIGDNKDIEGNEGLLLGELYLKFLVIEREIYYRRIMVSYLKGISY